MFELTVITNLVKSKVKLSFNVCLENNGANINNDILDGLVTGKHMDYIENGK